LQSEYCIPYADKLTNFLDHIDRLSQIIVTATTNVAKTTINRNSISTRSTPTCAECLGIVEAARHEAAGLLVTQELGDMSTLRDLKQE